MSAINNSANIFLQGSQLYQNANNRIFDAISMAANAYDERMRQREALLAAERQREIERQQKLQEQAMQPESILAQAIQQGPESLTPQQRAAFEANQRMAGAKVALDPFGRAYKPYEPISLGGAPVAVGPTSVGGDMGAMEVMPQPTGSMFEGLAPPPAIGNTGATPQDYFGNATRQAEAPAPIGSSEKINPRANPMANTPMGEMEGLKSDLQTQRAQREAEFKAGLEKRQVRTKVEGGLGSAIDQFKNINNVASKVINKVGFFASGAGKAMTPEFAQYMTGAKDVQEMLKTIQADSAFGTLQEMRANSPTGGALGAVAVPELEMLQASKAALSQEQNPQQLRENIAEYVRLRGVAVKKMAEAFKADYGEYPKGYEPKSFEKFKSEDGVYTKLKAAGYSDEQIKAYKKAKGIE